MWTAALRCNHILMKKGPLSVVWQWLSNLSFYWPMWQICMTKLHEPSMKSLIKFQMWICIGITRFLSQYFSNDGKLTAHLHFQNLNFWLNNSLKKPCKQCLVHILQQNFDFIGAYSWWLEKFETQLHRKTVFMWFQAETVRLAVLLR